MKAPVSYTNDPLDPPVTVAELADTIRVPATDPILSGLLTAATEQVIDFLGKDLKTRNWILEYWDWPSLRGDPRSNVSRIAPQLEEDIKLLMAVPGNRTTVNSVTISGEATTDYTLQDDYILFHYVSVTSDSAVKDLEISYQAGYGINNTDVPSQIREAIKFIAAYMYDHRGCPPSDVVKMSGANMLIGHLKAAERYL